MKKYNLDDATKALEQFLTSLGFDWQNDPNMKDSPKRIAKAYTEDLFQGCYQEEPKITAFENNNGYDGIVCQCNVEVKSVCAHHFLSFSGVAHVAYLPAKDGKIIGLSKLNRIVEYFSRRPQVQENLTSQIAEFVDKKCEGNGGVAVVIKAKHTCCSLRGVKHDSEMQTAKLTGSFITDAKVREEFYNMIKMASK